MADLDTNYPVGTNAPSVIDNVFRSDKEEWRLRLAVDHFFTKTTGTLIDTVAAGSGKHKQVTLTELAADPTPAANDGIVYTKDVDGETELFYKASGAALQLTSGETALNITIAGLVAIADGTTLYEDGDNKLAVQLDDVTLEYDATAKVQFKVPAATEDNDDLDIALIASGSYTGDGTDDREIDTGIVPRYVVVKRTDINTYAVCLISTGAEEYAWADGSGSDHSEYLSVSGTNIVVKNFSRTNAADKPYVWMAYGVRST